MIEEEKVLKLLQTLNDHGLKFEVEGTNTIYVKIPETIKDCTAVALLDAILGAQPDEFGWTDRGYRLWWD